MRARRRLRRFSAEHVNLVSPPLVARVRDETPTRRTIARVGHSTPHSPHGSHRRSHLPTKSHTMATQAAVMSAKATQVRTAPHARNPVTRFPASFLSRVAFPRNAVQKALRNGPASALRAREPAHAAPDGPARLADAPRASRGRVSPLERRAPAAARSATSSPPLFSKSISSPLVLSLFLSLLSKKTPRPPPSRRLSRGLSLTASFSRRASPSPTGASGSRSARRVRGGRSCRRRGCAR